MFTSVFLCFVCFIFNHLYRLLETEAVTRHFPNVPVSVRLRCFDCWAAAKPTDFSQTLPSRRAVSRQEATGSRGGVMQTFSSYRKNFTLALIAQVPKCVQISAPFLSNWLTSCLLGVLTTHIRSCGSRAMVSRVNIPILELRTPRLRNADQNAINQVLLCPSGVETGICIPLPALHRSCSPTTRPCLR